MGRRARQRDRVRGVVALLLLGVLSVDAMMLPRRGSWVGAALSRRTRMPFRSVMWHMENHDGVWLSSPGWDIDIDPDAPASPNDPVLARFERGMRSDGPWAPVVQAQWVTLRFMSVSAGLQEIEPVPELRAAAADYLATAHPTYAPEAAILATGNQRTSRILWGGVAHNLIALLIFAGAMWLMPWRRLWRYLDNRPEPVDPDACEHCDYNLLGLAADRCPECGHEIHPAVAGSNHSAPEGEGRDRTRA